MMLTDQNYPLLNNRLDLSTILNIAGLKVLFHKYLFYRIKNLNGLNTIQNNDFRDGLFVVFCLMFSYCYLMYNRIEFFGSLSNQHLVSSFDDLEHFNIDIRLQMPRKLQLSDVETNIIYSASPPYVIFKEVSILQIGASSIIPNASVKDTRGYF